MNLPIPVITHPISDNDPDAIVAALVVVQTSKKAHRNGMKVAKQQLDIERKGFRDACETEKELRSQARLIRKRLAIPRG